MHSRIETSHTPVRELYCDQFRRGPSYTNWRPRGSGDWLLIYTEAGSGQLVAAGETCATRTGDVLLYGPNDSQDYRTRPGAGRWHLLWVHFTPKATWPAWLHWPPNECGLKLIHLEKGEVRERFRAALLRMIRLSRRKLPGALDLAANALEEALLWGNVATSKGPWLDFDLRVRRAVDHLATHLREPFLLETLARHCGLSVSRLAHLFKQQVGLTPQQFLESQRMQHACKLLRLTSLNVAEVALEVGYPDAFYFTNRFRRAMGTSPSQFRRKSPGGAAPGRPIDRDSNAAPPTF